MFFFRKLFGLFFFGLLIFGLLGVFGYGRHGRYQAAYQQGFIDGQQAAAANSKAVPESAEGTAPAAPYQIPGANVYYRDHGFFFPSFGLLFCLVPLFFIAMLFMGFGRRRRFNHRRYRGCWGHYKGGHGRWGDWEDNSQEKSPDDIDDGPDEPIMRA